MRLAAMLPSFAMVGILAGCQDQRPTAPTDLEVNPLFSASSDEHRARVIHKGETWWCGMPDGNGDIVWPLYPVNIITQSRNGNAQHICHAEGVANPTGRAIVWKAADYPGEVCGVWNGPDDKAMSFPLDPDDVLWTTKWIQIISASGQATLICNYKE